MTGGSDNQDRSRRGSGRPLSEADVLAVIEQVADPGETIGASRDARLASRVQSMRVDRDALASLSELTAPPDLLRSALDEALALDERALLIGLAQEESRAEGIRRSAIIPLRDRLVDRVMDRPVRWLVSLAATLLLMLGGGAFLVARAIDGTRADQGAAPLAAASDPAGPEAVPGTLHAGAGPGDADRANAGGTLTVGVAANGSSVRDTAVLVTQGARVGEAGESAGEVTSLAEAAALLAERRLALHAQHTDSSRASAALVAVIDAGLDAGTWSLADVTAPGAADAVARDLPLPEPAVIAGNAGGRALAVAPVVRVGVWTLTTAPRATALASARAALETQGLAVRFVRLARPLPEALDADPPAVGWWELPPARWPGTATVPVVIDAASPAPVPVPGPTPGP